MTTRHHSMAEHTHYFTSLIPDSAVKTYVTKRNIPFEIFVHSELAEIPLARMRQIHSAVIKPVTSDLFGNELAGIEIRDSDAIYTTEKRIALAVRTADCLPILIYHPHPVIAAIHAGRRGTEAEILKHTLTLLKTRYGATTGYKIWFGPAISKKNYQIDPEKNIYFDLIAENETQIKSVLSPSGYTLYNANICTYDRTDLFYSHRKDGPITGRFYSLIYLE